MSAPNKKPHTIHKKETVLNTDKLKDIMEIRGLDYIQLHQLVVDKYGLDLSYKGLMSLIYKKSTWKLLYAWALADVLMVRIDSLFEIVDVDVEKKLEEKEKWKEKYQK